MDKNIAAIKRWDIILYITAKDCQRLQHVAFASLLLSPHHACKIMRDQKELTNIVFCQYFVLATENPENEATKDD